MSKLNEKKKEIESNFTPEDYFSVSASAEKEKNIIELEKDFTDSLQSLSDIEETDETDENDKDDFINTLFIPTFENDTEKTKTGIITKTIKTSVNTNKSDLYQLRNFLVCKGFSLVYDNYYSIDIYSYEYEFAFYRTHNKIDGSDLGEWTQVDVKEYFEKEGFKVNTVVYRDYRYKTSLRPIIKNEKLLKPGKDIFVVSVDADSQFFEDKIEPEYYEEKRLPDNPDYKNEKNYGLSRISKTIFMIITGIIISAIICTFLYTYKAKKTNNISIPEFSFEQPIENLKVETYEVELKPIRQDLFNITFFTTEGEKKFKNSTYKTQITLFKNNYIVSSYKNNYVEQEPYKIDIFPRSIVRSISMTRVE